MSIVQLGLFPLAPKVNISFYKLCLDICLHSQSPDFGFCPFITHSDPATMQSWYFEEKKKRSF